MSAPVNDLSSSATAISALFGSITGTNISASVEVGEPKWGNNPGFLQPKVENNNPYSSVWFLWSPVFGGTGSHDIFFTTRGASGSAFTNFPTVVQLFDWSPVGGIADEIGYTKDFCAGIGYDYGAFAAFTYTTSSNNQIMVRVSSRYPDKQGHFVLSWGNYYAGTLGDCNSCPPSFVAGEKCIGQVHVNDVKTDQNTNFTWAGTDTFPSGLYVMRYCKGYYSDVSWFVNGIGCGSDGSAPCCSPIGYYATNDHISVNYTTNAAGSQSNAPFQFIPVSYTSPIEVQTQTHCSQIMLPVYSGSIQFQWEGSSYPTPCDSGCPIPNDTQRETACGFIDTLPTGSVGLNGIVVDNGNPNPTFGLYTVAPAFVIANSSGNMRTACSTQFTGSFGIKNLGNAAWASCSIQIINTGEVTGASTISQSMGNIPTYGGIVNSSVVTFRRTSVSNTPFAVNANVYIKFYGGALQLGGVYQQGALLSTLGIPDLTASLVYEMNPTLPLGFVENGVSGFSRTGDVISASFKVNYAGLSSGDFYGGCGYFTASLRSNTNVTNVPVPVSVFNSSATAQTIPLSFTASPTGETRCLCLIDIQNPTGTIVKTLSYDLTPVISVTAVEGSPGAFTCGGVASGTWKITYQNIGLGSTANLALRLVSGSQCLTTNYPQTGLQIAGGGGSATFGCNTGGGCSSFMSQPFTISVIDGPFTHTPFHQA